MEAEDLKKQKLIEEVKCLKTNRLINVFKSFSILLGCIVLFILVQRPESILNKKSSEESINRERGKLILDLLEQSDNPQNILLGISILKETYPRKDNEWIEKIETIYKTKIQNNINYNKISLIDNEKKEQLFRARIKLSNLLTQRENYETMLLSEFSRIDMTGKAGSGPAANRLRYLLDRIDRDIKATEIEINSLEN